MMLGFGCCACAGRAASKSAAANAPALDPVRCRTFIFCLLLSKSLAGVSRRLCDHLVDHRAAAIEWPIVSTAKHEIGRAIDVLIDRTARQRAHGRSNGRRDDLVAVLDRGIERTAAVEIAA